MIKISSEKYSKRLFFEIVKWLQKVNNIYIENVKRNGSFDLDNITKEHFSKINDDSFTPPLSFKINGTYLELLARKTFEININDFNVKENKIKNKDVFKKIFEENKLTDTLGVYIFQKNISTNFNGTFFQKYHAIMLGIDTMEEMKKTLVHELTHYQDYIISILNLDKYKENDLYNDTGKIYYLPNKNKVIDPEQKYEYEFWAWYNEFYYEIKKLLFNSHPKHKNLSRIIFNQLFNYNSIEKIKKLKDTGKYNENDLDNIIKIINGKINSNLGKKVTHSISIMKSEIISSKIKKEILKEIKKFENDINNTEDSFENKEKIKQLKDYLNELKFKISYTYFLKKLISDLIKDNLIPNNTNFEEYKKTS